MTQDTIQVCLPTDPRILLQQCSFHQHPPCTKSMLLLDPLVQSDTGHHCLLETLPQLSISDTPPWFPVCLPGHSLLSIFCSFLSSPSLLGTPSALILLVISANLMAFIPSPGTGNARAYISKPAFPLHSRLDLQTAIPVPPQTSHFKPDMPQIQLLFYPYLKPAPPGLPRCQDLRTSESSLTPFSF